MNKKIALVTGGYGFIGSQIVKELQNSFDIIRIIDIGLFGKNKTLENLKYEEYNLDINENLDNIMKDVNVIFHCAAKISVSNSFNKIKEYHETNVKGTINLIEYAIKYNVKHFIFSSSCAIYGNSNKICYENSLVNPSNPYTLSKQQCEDYCKFYSKITSMKFTILRYSNVYGKNQVSDRPFSSLIINFFTNFINNKKCYIYGSGKQERDFVHVEDVAKSNLFVFNNKLEGTFNICVGKTYTLNKVYSIFENLFNYSQELEYSTERKGDIEFLICNNDKILSKNFNFKYSILEKGLKTFLD